MKRCSSLILSAGLLAVPMLGSAQFTELVPLSSDANCNRCEGFLLPGQLLPSPETVYRIDSDLPEIFLSRGVLYATIPTLPPFTTKDGVSVSEEQRRQRNNGFTTIDGSFEVFLYHMSNPGELPRQRRVVVYTRNTGDDMVTIRPRQIMEDRGRMGRFDGPEARLGIRQLADDFDVYLETVDVPVGEGRIVGWSPRLTTKDLADAAPGDFFTGTLRADVEAHGDAAASLEVFVVAIGADTTFEDMQAETERWLTVGAHSGEGAMDLNIPPPDCHVRRVVGVSRNFLWQSDDVILDAAAIPTTGIAFQMGAPMVQTVGCEQARQTQDMILHPGYVHPDTVGNYMQEYMVRLTLVNTSDEPLPMDLRFGKQDADIGLAWQIAIDDEPLGRDAMIALPIRTEWAGGWRRDDLPDNTRSFLIETTQTNEADPIVLPAGEHRTVTLRFFVLGTASLPFQLHVFPAGGALTQGGYAAFGP